MNDQQKLGELLANQEWRLNNLYYIIDKNANKVRFEMNIFQEEVYKNLHYNNIILKSRQLGLSTFVEIFILDNLLFRSNITAGIIDATLPDAKKKLDKVKFAYENFALDYPTLREEFLKIRKVVKSNEQEFELNNGSSVTADTTFRGSTIQILHISEYAKICKRDVIKAQEIKTGAFNAVGKGQYIFVESTAEDAEGHFYELSTQAEKLSIEKTELSPLDFKFFFFPWWKEVGYKLQLPIGGFVFSQESKEYFNLLETSGIKLTDSQKYWYVKKKEVLNDDIKKEYPSTSLESFEASTEDKYYKKEMLAIRARNQICEFDIQIGHEIDTYWDLGRSKDGYTSIIFLQTIGKELRIVDFLEGMDEHISFYAQELKKKQYFYGKVWLPHDSLYNLLGSEKTIFRQMQDFGFKCGVVKKLGEDIGINEVRKILPSCWFRKSTTVRLIEHLEKFSKKWNEQLGRYTGPREDEHIHACLTEDTLVLTDKGNVLIKDINIGDMVWTPCGYSKVYNAGPTKIASKVIKIETIDGVVLKCTPEHEIFTNRGLVRADELRYNDVIWKQIDQKRLSSTISFTNFRDDIMSLHLFPQDQNSVTAIAKLTIEDLNKEVYDLSVEKHHCYLANGILVSNCDAFRYLAVNQREKRGGMRPIFKIKQNDSGGFLAYN